jgi:hypothetical protein
MNKDLIDWFELSANPNAISLLKSNINEINWYKLPENPNPNAIDFIKEHLDKIDWYYLSSNPNAISLLEKNFDKIDWDLLMTNPAIFTYDYKMMKEIKSDLNEEVIAKALHPKRMLRLMNEYGEDEIYNIYFDD